MRTPTIASAQYAPHVPPEDPKDLRRYLETELAAISAAIDRLADGHVDPIHVAPEKPRDGDIRLADGTDWNPGHGQGKYIYYAGKWNYLSTGEEIDLALANGGGFCPLQVTASSTARLPLDRRSAGNLSYVSVTANRVYAVPVLAGTTYTTDAISIYQNFALACNSRAAIASDNSSGGLHRPGALVSQDATLTQSLAGERLHAFTAVTLEPGVRYWLLFTASSAINVSTVTAASVMPWMGNVSHGVSPTTHLYATFATSLASVVAADSWTAATGDYPSILTRPA